MIRYLPAVLMLSVGLLACSEANFDNKERIDSSSLGESDNSPNEADKEIESQLAAEPVSVGGAFLTCSYEAKESEGVHKIGCDIRNDKDQSLSGKGTAEFSILEGQPLAYALSNADLPYLISVPAEQLLDKSRQITATLSGLDVKDIIVLITIEDLVNSPEVDSITGFQSYVALFASAPGMGESGQIKLRNNTCLESSDVVFSGGTKVQFKPCNAELDAQLFMPVVVENDSFVISQNDQTSCIDIPFEGGVYVPQINIYNECHMGINQQFKLVKSEVFYSAVSLTSPDLCLSYDGDADLMLKPCF